ncbi:hypothetical protein [Rudaeicoccus suwonensis]|uniref:Uncharacterized protein n=1 Tax=Rudaeicoccus suwonensis TaxID=657409 RepID=A0A561E7R8_9MICO|nr:hypothetical protein [Rudaeicoccus suwonensis]TWE11651.1 hypothetical protein BKA23_0432 [Rudaeicoccus suwonensis]
MVGVLVAVGLLYLVSCVTVVSIFVRTFRREEPLVQPTADHEPPGLRLIREDPQQQRSFDSVA